MWGAGWERESRGEWHMASHGQCSIHKPARSEPAAVGSSYSNCSKRHAVTNGNTNLTPAHFGSISCDQDP